jgi:hypothetical protein
VALQVVDRLRREGGEQIHPRRGGRAQEYLVVLGVGRVQGRNLLTHVGVDRDHLRRRLVAERDHVADLLERQARFLEGLEDDSDVADAVLARLQHLGELGEARRVGLLPLDLEVLARRGQPLVDLRDEDLLQRLDVADVGRRSGEGGDLHRLGGGGPARERERNRGGRGDKGVLRYRHLRTPVLQGVGKTAGVARRTGRGSCR